MKQNITIQIQKFTQDTLNATQLLYENRLLGQMLVIMYSAIDTMGLLDAPPSTKKATGETFQNWVRKYLLKKNNFEFNALDLWAARCAVLHTFTAESELSNSGKAKKIFYISGNTDMTLVQALTEGARSIDNGTNVPAIIEDVHLAFSSSLQNFSQNLVKNCQTDPTYNNRLIKVLQHHSL